MSSICVKYFRVLNLVCTMKFLKYKSFENFQLYGTFSPTLASDMTIFGNGHHIVCSFYILPTITFQSVCMNG